MRVGVSSSSSVCSGLITTPSSIGLLIRWALMEIMRTLSASFFNSLAVESASAGIMVVTLPTLIASAEEEINNKEKKMGLG